MSAGAKPTAICQSERVEVFNYSQKTRKSQTKCVEYPRCLLPSLFNLESESVNQTCRAAVQPLHVLPPPPTTEPWRAAADTAQPFHITLSGLLRPRRDTAEQILPAAVSRKDNRYTDASSCNPILEGWSTHTHTHNHRLQIDSSGLKLPLWRL